MEGSFAVVVPPGTGRCILRTCLPSAKEREKQKKKNNDPGKKITARKKKLTTREKKITARKKKKINDPGKKNNGPGKREKSIKGGSATFYINYRVVGVEKI